MSKKSLTNKQRQEIGPPKNFEHVTHMSYDSAAGSYLGTPHLWRKTLAKRQQSAIVLNVEDSNSDDEGGDALFRTRSFNRVDKLATLKEPKLLSLKTRSASSSADFVLLENLRLEDTEFNIDRTFTYVRTATERAFANPSKNLNRGKNKVNTAAPWRIDRKENERILQQMLEVIPTKDPRTCFEVQNTPTIEDAASGLVLLREKAANIYRLVRKICAENRQDLSCLNDELALLTEINHKNILRIIDVFQFEQRLFLVYNDNNESVALSVILQLGPKQALPGNVVTFIARELAAAMDAVHRAGYVHRDIQSTSIVISKSCDVKLAEFQHCKNIKETGQTTDEFLGAPHWMAPEVARKQAYGYGADVWSYGITVIEMVQSLPPYSECPIEKMYSLLNLSEKPPSADVKMDPLLESMIELCLVIDAEARAKAHQVLQHPVFFNTMPEPEFKYFLRQLIVLNKLNV